MAILAGIDEAGYGPILGPLVVSGVAFRVPDEQLNASLWEVLRATTTMKTGRSERRLPVADSKKLHRSSTGIAPLERTALTMLVVGGHRVAGWRALLEVVAPHVLDQLREYPWYRAADLPLPVTGNADAIGTQANAVRRDCAANNVELLGVLCEPLPEGHFNRLVRNTRNKAAVLLSLALRIADRIQRLDPTERVRICVDRLGGRQHYREALQPFMPGHALYIVEESDQRSAYHLVQSARHCDIEFATKGEERHFPVALASIYSKYLRELFMHAFNSYWSNQLDGLNPTAGYYTDAQRWLGDVEALLAKASIDRGMLVRDR